MMPIFTLSLFLQLPLRLRLLRVMSALMVVLPLPTSLILLIDCLELGVVVLTVFELVAVVIICIVEVPPRCLHGDAKTRPVIPLNLSELERSRLSA